MARLCATCGDTVSWHRQVRLVRGACTRPGCQCGQFLDLDSRGGNAVAPTPSPVVISTSAPVVTNQLHEVTAQGGKAAMFMLDLAGSALADTKLNKLTPKSMLAIAQLPKTRKCFHCDKFENAARDWGINSPGISGLMASFIAHLNAPHISDMFGVPHDLVHMDALTKIRAGLDTVGDVVSGSVADTDMIRGLRMWSLEFDESANKFVLAPPHHDSGERYESKWVEATCRGNRQLALTHLDDVASGATVNEATLDVKVNHGRAPCTCGIYAYTTLDGLKHGGYHNLTQIMGQVRPWGTWHLASDYETFRASDVKIEALSLYASTTMINSIAPPQLVGIGDGYYRRSNPWEKWTGSVNYDGLCQQIADQFECPVFLRDRHETVLSEYVPTPKIALPDWMVFTAPGAV